MRLVTRADFDGVACAVFITMMEQITETVFTHPRDLEEGTFQVLPGDVIANLPFHPNAGLWFDHHFKAEELPDPMPNVRGKCGVAPSAARLVYEFYNSPLLKPFETFLLDVDKVDSAHLDYEDVLHPKGWVLLSYTIDPRSSFAGFRDYALRLIVHIRRGMPVEEILELEEVKNRVDRFLADEEVYRKALSDNTVMDDNVIITDFRGLDRVPAGNRFLPFTLWTRGNVHVRIFWNYQRDKVMVAVGKSIFLRDSKVHVGKLMAQYGGGGQQGAGTCPLNPATADRQIQEIVTILKEQ